MEVTHSLVCSIKHEPEVILVNYTNEKTQVRASTRDLIWLIALQRAVEFLALGSIVTISKHCIGYSPKVHSCIHFQGKADFTHGNVYPLVPLFLVYYLSTFQLGLR